MDCSSVEARLSEYAEQTLPVEEMNPMDAHLRQCRQCSVLLDEMHSALAACRAFPVLEPRLELVERVLLRTSGRPRTRSFKELLQQYFIQPMLTPRFAVGAALAAMFAVLVLTLVGPRMNVIAVALSPQELLRDMDRGIQQLYSEGLKAYDKKNEWQAQFTFFKNNVLNKLGFMIEQFDVPPDTKAKPGEPQREKKSGAEKSSILVLPA